MTDLSTQAIVATIDDTNAQALLIAESQQRLVMAYFWAAANAPSQQLLPILEKIANDYAGDFLLGKVNVAEHPTIARQLGIQSLPTVMLIQNGRPIDGFAGMQSESEIRKLLDKYLPNPWDKMLVSAKNLIENGDFSEALVLLRQAYTESQQQPDIAIHLAQVYMALNRLDEAESLLKTIPLAEQDALYQQLVSQLALKRTAAKTPEIDTLEKALANEPDNLDIKMQLAIQYQQEHQTRKALELLIQILKTDKNYKNGEAKKTILDIFKSLGSGDPLVTEFQRQLFSLLY
jgi:putative thioredoxin